jgi:hypothetical protein
MAKSESKKKRRTISLGDTALSYAKNVTDIVDELGEGFMSTVNGLIVDGQPELEKWSPVGVKLRVQERGTQFRLGDFYNELLARFGDDMWNIIDASEGWSLKTIENYGWLASRIKLANRRMDRLGVRHHQLVAPLTEKQQIKWLTAAAADNEEQPWTVARLRKAIEEGEDLPVTAFFLLVKCKSASVRDKLQKKLTEDGFDCKARDSRKRKAAEPKAE